MTSDKYHGNNRAATDYSVSSSQPSANDDQAKPAAAAAKQAPTVSSQRDLAFYKDVPAQRQKPGINYTSTYSRRELARYAAAPRKNRVDKVQPVVPVAPMPSTKPQPSPKPVRHTKHGSTQDSELLERHLHSTHGQQKRLENPAAPKPGAMLAVPAIPGSNGPLLRIAQRQQIQQQIQAKRRELLELEKAELALQPTQEQLRASQWGSGPRDASTPSTADSDYSSDAGSGIADKGLLPADAESDVVRHSSPEQAQGSDNNDWGSDTDYPVWMVTAHRVRGPPAAEPDGIDLLVHWDKPGKEPTWEPEEELQGHALEAIADYWDTVEEGRLSERPYEVYAIRGHEWEQKGKTTRKQLYFEIEWYGYRETSWEPESRFAKDAPHMVKEYFDKLGGRPKP